MNKLRSTIRKFLIKEVTGYKLYLDDERMPQTPGPWVIVRSYAEFIKTIQQRGVPRYISFDNDLQEEMEGKDCAKWLINNRYDLRGMGVNIHSANSKAPEDIYTMISNWNKMLDKYGTDYTPDIEYEK